MITKNNIQKRINMNFNTTWYFEDFFYAFCNARKIDYPDSLPKSEYKKLEDECKELLSEDFLKGLKNVVIEDINERLVYAMGEL